MEYAAELEGINPQVVDFFTNLGYRPAHVSGQMVWQRIGQWRNITVAREHRDELFDDFRVGCVVCMYPNDAEYQPNDEDASQGQQTYELHAHHWNDDENCFREALEMLLTGLYLRIDSPWEGGLEGEI